MERQYNIVTKVPLGTVRDLLLNRGYKKYDELGEEFYTKKELGLILDLKIPSIFDVGEYRRKFPNGIKFPRALLVTDTASTRITRDRPDEYFNSLTKIIDKEISEIAKLLKQKHQTEMYVSDYSQDERDIVLEDMKRTLCK